MSIDGCKSPLEDRRRDRGDVVDKPLCRNLNQLRRHVSTDGNDMRSIEGKDCTQGPIGRSSVEEYLLAACGIDGTHRVVATTEGNQLAVWRPTGAINGVKSHRYRECQFPAVGIPHLDLTHSRR